MKRWTPTIGYTDELSGDNRFTFKAITAMMESKTGAYILFDDWIRDLMAAGAAQTKEKHELAQDAEAANALYRETLDYAKKLERAGDAFLHSTLYSDDTAAVRDAWWDARGGAEKCTACNDPLTYKLPGSSAVEQRPVKATVTGSIPVSAAIEDEPAGPGPFEGWGASG